MTKQTPEHAIWKKRRALYRRMRDLLALVEGIEGDLKASFNREYDMGLGEDAANLEEIMNVFQQGRLEIARAFHALGNVS
jgi:hypothetical protein